MNFRKVSVLMVSMAMTIGLAVSYAQAQTEPKGDEKARLSQQDQRQQELQRLLEQVQALKKEIEASQRQQAAGQQERVAELLNQFRPSKAAAGQPARKMRPQDLEGRELEMKVAESTRQAQAQVALQGGQGVLVPNKPVGQAKGERAKEAEEGNEGIKIIFNGREINLGEGQPVTGKVVPEGRTAQPLVTNVEPPAPGAQWQVVPGATNARPGASAGQVGSVIVLNDGRERESREENEGREGGEVRRFTFSTQPGAPSAGNPYGAPQGRPGQPAVTTLIPVPGGAKPPAPGNPWQAAAGANAARPGAFGGQAGGTIIFQGGQDREGREAEEREAQERREGGGLRLPPPVRPGAGAPANPAPRGPGATGWGQPIAGAPAPATIVRTFAAQVPADQLQQLQKTVATLHTLQQACSDPQTAAMIAIKSLQDENPRIAIGALENALRKTRTLGLRTAIHISLKDLYKAQGNEEMVLYHLGAVLAENDEALGEHKGDGIHRGGEKDGPSHKIKDGGKKDKADDGDDEKEEEEED